jgi:hypothetical protein
MDINKMKPESVKLLLLRKLFQIDYSSDRYIEETKITNCDEQDIMKHKCKKN